MLLIPVNRFNLDDRLIRAIRCLSKGQAAFQPTEFIFYLGPIVDVLHSTAYVAMKSMLSKLVSANELGQVLAIFSLDETIIPVIFKPLYSLIHQKTLHRLSGAFYIFGEILNITGIFIFLCMYKKHEQMTRDKFTEEKQALIVQPP